MTRSNIILLLIIALAGNWIATVSSNRVHGGLSILNKKMEMVATKGHNKPLNIGLSEHEKKLFLLQDRPLENVRGQKGYKQNILLLGDSRFRFLYHTMMSEICNAHAYISEYRWCKPGYFSERPFGSRIDRVNGQKLFNFEMSAGARCNQSSTHSIFAFFSHFGVSPDGRYVGGWGYHLHNHWNGPGSTSNFKDGDSIQGIDQEDSVALTIEAAKRFTRNTPTTSSCIVYSALLWDSIRFNVVRYDDFGIASLRDTTNLWRTEYERNLTIVLNNLSKISAEKNGSLVLINDFNVFPGSAYRHDTYENDIPSIWKQRIANETIIPEIQNITKIVAKKLNLVLVDLEELLQKGWLQSMKNTVSSAYRDHVHPSDKFSEFVWGDIEKGCMSPEAKQGSDKMAYKKFPLEGTYV